jgi:poly(3-hydroxybutyrate) depolymerase
MSRAASLLSAFVVLVSPAAAGAQLAQVPSFGSNPGALDMYKYVPDGMPDDAPLVVLLHGCSQQASGMIPTGFLDLADEYHFYLVLPQQRSGNNPVNCFNWAGEYGDPANLVRGQGENLSIKQMIDKMKADHSIDAAHVYVAGFSSGAAFAAVRRRRRDVGRPLSLRHHRAGRVRLHGARLAPRAQEDTGPVGRPGARRQQP